MKLRARLALAALLFAAACATPSGGPTPPPASGGISSTPLDLGDWQNGQTAAVLAHFESAVASRYAAGVALNAAMTDLRTAQFTCAPMANRDEREGDPPTQVCRRTVTANACTHTWQVHLFETGGLLARSRGLYDRRCGNDPLLGGPG